MVCKTGRLRRKGPRRQIFLSKNNVKIGEYDDEKTCQDTDPGKEPPFRYSIFLFLDPLNGQPPSWSCKN